MVGEDGGGDQMDVEEEDDEMEGSKSSGNFRWIKWNVFIFRLDIE